LCAICDTNVDCLFAGALCLKDDSPYGFCGKACSEADCPSGFICTEMDLDGALVAQCYPESGSCCGGGEWIECDFDNPCAIGQCHPTLGCTEEPVDADCSGQDPCLDYHCIDGECIGTPLASDWTLDGVDDDCDGETDEDAMLGLAVTGYLWSGGSGTAVDSAFSILGNTSGVTFSGTISDGKYVIRAGLPQPETTN
jgi:hypothetical protein